MTEAPPVRIAKGPVGALLLALALLLGLYGECLRNANHVYFATGGDGLLTYSEAAYHIRHDNTAGHYRGMNYPFGESIFFTSSLPALTNTFRLLNKWLPIEHNIVGIINLSLLIALLLSAWFSAKLLNTFSLPWWWVAAGGFLWAMGSPQLHRLSGHFALGWAFLTPWTLYRWRLFSQSPSWKNSGVIAALLLVAGLIMAYQLAFLLLLLGACWVVAGRGNLNPQLTRLRLASHAALQMALPLVLVSLLMADTGAERTAFPWGFFVFLSTCKSVFYPLSLLWHDWYPNWFGEGAPEWEGVAFCGTLSAIMTLLFPILMLFKQVRALFSPNALRFLLACYAGGMVALLVAMGYPWLFDWAKPLLVWVGPLRQLRALGRFSLLFYYALGACTYVVLGTLLARLKKPFQVALSLVALGASSIDAAAIHYPFCQTLPNRLPAFDQAMHGGKALQQHLGINPNVFQATLPLSFSHIGSENYWCMGDAQAFEQALQLGLEIGLPTMGCSLSRTALNQTYDLVRLVQPGNGPPKWPSGTHSTKPFLVVRGQSPMRPFEMALWNAAQPIKADTAWRILTPSEWEQVHAKWKQKNLSLNPTPFRGIRSSFNAMPNDLGLEGSGAFTCSYQQRNILLQTTLPDTATRLTLSWWMAHFTTDLIPRGSIEVLWRNPQGTVLKGDYPNLNMNLAMLQDHWGLIRIALERPPMATSIEVSIWNDNLIKPSTLVVDELWLHPAASPNPTDDGAWRLVNNERYHRTP